MRNDTLCRQFLERGGLERLLSTIELSCIPILFVGFTNTAHALSHLLRAIGDHDHVKLVNTLINSIKGGLGRSSDLWKANDADVNWQALHDYTASEELRSQLEVLRVVSIQVALLTDTFNGFTWTHGKVVTFLCRSLLASEADTFIADLGALHRICARQQFGFGVDSSDPALSSPALPLPSPATVMNNNAPDLHTVQPRASAKNEPGQPGFIAVRLYGVLTKAFRGEFDDRAPCWILTVQDSYVCFIQSANPSQRIPKRH